MSALVLPAIGGKPRVRAGSMATSRAAPSVRSGGSGVGRGGAGTLDLGANADELRANRAAQQSDDRVAKLNQLVDEFGAFNTELHASEWAVREADEVRMQRSEQTIGRLQRLIAGEVEARIAVTEDVATNLDAQCDNLAHAQAERLVAAKLSVEVDLAFTENRIELATVTFEQDRVATQRAIERAHVALLKMLLELRDALGVEIATRIEREALAAQRVADEVFALQELLQGEAGAFQASLGHMRDAQEQARTMLVKSDEAFKLGIMAQLTACQRDLKAECDERFAVEKQLVASLEDYAGGLEDGLRNVNMRVRDDGQIR
ncbi:SF-assemblin/beta giardin-domain-containing protein [Pavlovales sp. CCMP2436]|nr:SF-assemblin/beta giardin-domain-containing protein [Pavlovales sp. CCMP2436]